MIVKENQRDLRRKIELLLDTEVARRVKRVGAVEREMGHGRMERRELVSSEVLAGWEKWPGLSQIFRLKRERVEKKTGKREEEVVYGITSLTGRKAGPRQLLGLVRCHWRIENKSHHVRDVTYGEDGSQARVGSIPQVMAALRNTAIGLLRLAGHTNIAAGCRYYAARPWDALVLIGIPMTIK